MNKKGLGLIFFGTSINEAQKGLDGLRHVAQKLVDPSWVVSECFTSKIILRKLQQEGAKIFSPWQMVAHLYDQGVSDLFLMPSYIMPGFEQEDMENFVQGVGAITGKWGFQTVKIGRPFMDDDRSAQEFAQCCYQSFKDKVAGDEGLLFMGHGTAHQGGRWYEILREKLIALDSRFDLACVEDQMPLHHAIDRLKSQGINKVLLAPCMIVAGDHARNDMAGEDEDSWVATCRRAGLETRVCLEGLGEQPLICELYGQRLNLLTKDR